MFQPDSLQDFNPDSGIGDNDAINNDMISEIEKELQDNPYDMISLVFLLYDVPDTALQRLIVFQRISKDIGTSTNLNMLHEWFRHAKHSPTWKHEFVEALILCQLNVVVRKLGLNVSSARNHYHPDNIQVKMYINPVKKALYKLCENMNTENVLKIKKTLLTYDIDTSEYDSSELIFLKLMCERFIIVNQYQYNKKVFGVQAQLDKLVRIIKNLPGLQNTAQEINMLQESLNESSKPSTPIAYSTPSAPVKVDESSQGKENPHMYSKDFATEFCLLGELNLEENNYVKSLKSDKTKLGDDRFEIKNPKKIGVCVILNQVDFYPSKNSLENANQCSCLSKRVGSDKDKAVLERTMSALNFSVYSATNLNHIDMFNFLKQVIKTKVSEEDSVFMLCILSHGVKGHVYAADSVKIKIDDFQNLLDSDIAAMLYNKPKLLIVQACQVDETPQPTLVADNPGSFTLRKTDFLICWATAPELEAFRDEKKGSIFIQVLCNLIKKYANTEHFADIFTFVRNEVTFICEMYGCPQVPISYTTLRKKLYIPLLQQLN